jgi:hypothetical protein
MNKIIGEALGGSKAEFDVAGAAFLMVANLLMSLDQEAEGVEV